uniref:Reverse transcriptase zinc-binding domain-containing protein n=1 Tax=Fagus sylvatica TaxID=28930 RepID=A0A2N9HDV0_FAGSY
MWLFSIRLYWGSDCGDMLLNQWPYGIGLLIANMVANGGDGVLIIVGSLIWDQLLRGRFSTLFRLAHNQEASVADYLHFHGTLPVWDVEFLRPTQDWELDAVDSFMGFLYSLPMRPGIIDSIFWNLSRHASFEVSSFYSALSQPATSQFPWRLMWKAKVPSRVAFFIWTASLGKILTTDNLRKRRVIILDWCCLCKVDGESINHLLLHCLVARDLWNLVCCLFGVSWVMPSGVVDLLFCWNGSLGNREASKIWKMIPHYIMWCLWGERNSRIFNEGGIIHSSSEVPVSTGFV